MLFSSFPICSRFFPIVAGGNLALRRTAGPRAAQAWLLLASLFFYGWARPRTCRCSFGSIVFNWAVARVMAATRGKRKRWSGRARANIGLLCSFKYVNFSGIRYASSRFPTGIFPSESASSR